MILGSTGSGFAYCLIAWWARAGRALPARPAQILLRLPAPLILGELVELLGVAG